MEVKLNGICVALFWAVGLLVGGAATEEHHLFGHTHNDLGGFQTISHYYTSIVEQIFKSTIGALEAQEPKTDPRLKRKFVYSEVGFLKLFLKANPDYEPRLKALTDKGQWGWVNGGISQADSACTSFEDIATNYFAGQRYLKQRFGVTSKTAWQLDPFGHSTSLMAIAHLFGMRHAFFIRIPGSLKAAWSITKSLQFVWKLPNGAEMTSHVHHHYNSPSSLGCDTDCSRRPFRQNLYRVEAASNDGLFRKENFFFLGGDFNWSEALSRFTFVDSALLQNPDTRYSTPEEYAAVFEKSNPRESLPVFTDDFFVYNPGLPEKGDAWSGFFTTKPRLKHKIRRAQKLLREFKALFALTFFGPKRFRSNGSLLSHDMTFSLSKFLFGRPTDPSVVIAHLIDLTEEISLFLHHDAITGTSEDHVDQDYLDRLAAIETRLLGLLEVSPQLHADDGLSEGPSEAASEVYDHNDVITGVIPTCKFFSAYKNNKVIKVSFSQTLNHRGDEVRRFLLPSDGDFFTVDVRDSDGNPVDFIRHCDRRPGVCEVYVQVNFSKVDVHAPVFYTLQRKEIPREDLGRVARPHEVPQVVELNGEEQEIQLTGGRLVVSKNKITFFDREGVSGKELTYKYINAGDSDEYILRYNGDTRKRDCNEWVRIRYYSCSFMKLTHFEGTTVSVTSWDVFDKPVFYIDSFVKKDNEVLAAGADIVFLVSHNDLGNPYLNMTTDSNGLFTVRRQVRKSFEESVYPVTAYARIDPRSKDSLGLLAFNDRPQGVFATNFGLGFYIQRSARDQDGKDSQILKVRENVAVEHAFYFFHDAPDEDVFWNHRNRQDTLKEHFYSVLDSRSLRTPGRPLTTLTTEYPFLRFNFEFVDVEKALVRVWNLSSEPKTGIPLKAILSEAFPTSALRIVDGSYVYGPLVNPVVLPEQVSFKPYEPITVVFGKLSV